MSGQLSIIQNRTNVAITGRFLNHPDQGDCLWNILAMAPSEASANQTRTPNTIVPALSVRVLRSRYGSGFADARFPVR